MSIAQGTNTHEVSLHGPEVRRDAAQAAVEVPRAHEDEGVPRQPAGLCGSGDSDAVQTHTRGEWCSRQLVL